MKQTFTLLLFSVLFSWASAQQAPDISARKYLLEHAQRWDLQAEDLRDLAVTDQYETAHNGVTHVYLVQRHAGIPVHNAKAGLHLQEGEVKFATCRFIPELADRINTTTPSIGAYQAVQAAAAELDVSIIRPLTVLEAGAERTLFAGGEIAHNDIEVRLVYFHQHETGEVRLAWNMAIDQVTTSDYWSIRVDAVTGEVLERTNWTRYCGFTPNHRHDDRCRAETSRKPSIPAASGSLFFDGGSAYNVFPLPVESPIHGERQLLTDPADPTASPFGWHDTNGQAGAEYTITRGNNVHAYLDEEAANMSQGDEPDGGTDLLFDFYFDLNDEPQNMKEASVTQLFYMNNMMHDFTYHYGFDEAAGNFQQRNYTNEGQGNDYVRAEAQDGEDVNNANFGTPPDGSAPRMQMFIWTAQGGRLMTVLEPEPISGAYETGSAGYGPPLTETPIEAPIAIGLDGSGSPELGCEPLINPEELEGKIAMVNRGGCYFQEKTTYAQEAGAVALIICNYENSTVQLGGAPITLPPADIPTISMKSTDCQTIRLALNAGTPVIASLAVPSSSGPSAVTSDFDNGIIAHEYGHGISNRLTDGPSSADCLFNDEQMGEGWSDFFTLVTTVRPDDTGDMARGIGNYARRNEVNGGGIRRLPYSTDMAVNDQVYDDIIGTTAPHPLGEVWTGMLWDLYWALVDEYGFDEDLINGTGGNNIAIQLVMDGMKLQACNPGFIDGRDAILAADLLNNDGQHECLIWEVFARRGLGFFADQNSHLNRNDGFQDFHTQPECIQELKIAKSVDQDLILPGDEVTIRLEVTNHKPEAVTEVTVNDLLPEGLAYVTGSATGAEVTDNGNSLTFTLDGLAAGESQLIEYTAQSAADLFSIRQFFDNMENGDNFWYIENLEGIDIWELTEDNPYEGAFCWRVAATEEANDQVLGLLDPFEVTGDAPAVRFYHNYRTAPGVMGGLVQITTDGGANWEYIPDRYIRGGYRGQLSYNAFTIPYLSGFWGDSEAYIASYIDLSPYLGETIGLRFRFGKDAGDALTNGGWYVDNFEVMDLFRYQAEACVTSAEGDLACAELPRGGIIVESGIINDTDEADATPTNLTIFPNPARDRLNVALHGQWSGQGRVQLRNMSGVLVQEWSADLYDHATLRLPLQRLPAGMYLLDLQTPQGQWVEKVTIQ